MNIAVIQAASQSKCDRTYDRSSTMKGLQKGAASGF